MATDTLTSSSTPLRVFYSTGRMLGVEDFQADQDYHRSRLARALSQLYGTGTLSGLLVQTDGNADPAKLEIQVTPGVAIDRLGRIIEAPRMVCIVIQNWLTQTVQAWQNQLANPVPGQTALPDPNTAIRGGKMMVDVFATFVPCTRGLTPCFAAQDDFDATDAFSANRLLDSFAMQLVLRTDSALPLTPTDPWKSSGAEPAAGSALDAPTAPNLTTLQNLILGSTAGPAAAAVEYPPGFDATSVFLARIQFNATAGGTGQPPTWDLTTITIDNHSRLFVYPPSLLARLSGTASGTES
jgi:hypothetical protein